MDTLSKRVKLSILLVILAAFTVVCVSTGGGGQDTASNNQGPLSASIVEISGTVQVLKASEGVFKDAVVEQELEDQDQVLTHEDGRARIDLSTGTIIRLSPLSNFTFETMENTEEGVFTRLRLEVGRLWVILNGGQVEVDTPSGLASVRGSYLHVWVRPEDNETLVTCLEGECSLGNEYGTVSLVAGQTASITGINLPPSKGKMSQEDVDEWLENNPEATMVLIQLTATVAANEGINLNSTKAPSPTPLVISTKTPTIAATDADCGPPGDWVLHTVTSGETLTSLASAFQVSVDDLKQANCRGISDAIVVGEALFVPNVPTITPTPTKTPIPTSTPKPTAASTAVPTNSPMVMTSPIGPDGTTLTDFNLCTTKYSINITDPDGVAEVKMIYSLDGTVPDWNTAVGQGKYKLLSSVGGGKYEANFMIPSYNAVGGVVKYRFAAKDSKGVLTYKPETGAYSFLDNAVKCGAPTNFEAVVAPETPIDDAAICSREYAVTVTDLNGVSEVYLWYKITDNSGTPNVTNTIVLPSTGADTYGVPNYLIDTSGFFTPITIIYEFKALDGHGNTSAMGTKFSFIDNVGCLP